MGHHYAAHGLTLVQAVPHRLGHGTQKQRFDLTEGRAVVGLRERAEGLKPFGWKGRRAEWIALACCHGGVFTRVQ
ncbi:MAG: hypothetical protein OXH08_04165, partial [Gammaproteobacteria bacterium]|nr:hypothetical protein [Gammaproteobacteria bacterium]